MFILNISAKKDYLLCKGFRFISENTVCHNFTPDVIVSQTFPVIK